MLETSSINITPIVTSVILFVIFLILILVIVDHKARISGGVAKGPVKIIGTRRNHPIWSYIIGGIVLLIIGTIGVELAAAIRYRIPGQVPEPTTSLLDQLEERREVELARHFHNPATARTLEGKKTVCYHCHGDFPHFEQRMIRTLLNMHTQFLGCMTCHADPDLVNEETITLRWLNSSGIDVDGPHFGTDFAPETGFLVETDDYYSKIVPYRRDGDVEKLLEITEDDPLAKEFVRVQNELKGPDRDAVKKSFHRIVAAKGRFCTRCHTSAEESFIPFQELGFSDRRIGELTSLNIIGLVQKYKRFYMPNLSGQAPEPEDGGPFGSQEMALPNMLQEIRNDPKSWWRSGTEDSVDQGQQTE